MKCGICDKTSEKMFKTAENFGGVLCKRCNYSFNRIIKSQKLSGIQVDIKRRKCLKCDGKFLSINSMRVCGECKFKPDWGYHS